MTTIENNLPNPQAVIKNELKYLESKGFSTKYTPSGTGCESSAAVLVRAEKESVSKKGVHFRAVLSCISENPEEKPLWNLSVRINSEFTHNYSGRNFAAMIGYLENEYRQ